MTSTPRPLLVRISVWFTKTGNEIIEMSQMMEKDRRIEKIWQTGVCAGLAIGLTLGICVSKLVISF